MVGLPRRLIRFSAYGVVFLTIAGILLFIANSNNISINQYLPEYLIPSFFQPSADSYVVDIAITSCFKFNGNNPSCGLPPDNQGLYGKVAGSSAWIKVDKDLGLGSEWMNKHYFSYKSIDHEAFTNQEGGSNLGERVITDLAVFGVLDGKINDNKYHLPLKVIEDFHREYVFDDETLEQYTNNEIAGELYKEDSHLNKASDANREYEKKLKQKEKQEEKQKENQKQKEKQEKQKLDEEEIKAKQEAEKAEAVKQKADSKAKEEAKIKEEAEQKQKAKAKEQVEGAPKQGNSKEKVKRTKRIVEKDNKALKIDYKLPSLEQVTEKGWESKGNGIWVKYESHTTKQGLTGIDILFGRDAVDPRPNWELIREPISGINGKQPAFLSFRRGPKLDYKSKFPVSLKVDGEGRFKILQVADLHFSTGYGQCRDPVPKTSGKGCLADPTTLGFVEKVLEIEKPDLVILTGDQIFGDASPDSESALFKALNPFIKRKIPFAVTLGNHDDEGSMSRAEIMSLTANLPYSLAALGPDEVAGVGNYIVNIETNYGKNSAVLLYLLDTHKYSPNPKVNPGYDWIKESQLKFLERQHASIKDSFTSDHLSMAFFHIPLPEYRNLKQVFIGENREGVTAPRYNTGARTVLGQLGVKVISVGHDHCNDYCLEDIQNKDDEIHENKMWLCYGGGSGEGGYGGYGGYVRRLRVFDINTSKGEIKSWKRRQDSPEKVFDEQILVTGGNVVNWR